MAIIFVQMEIAAAPEVVLAVLSNFDAYRRWNPILRRIEPHNAGLRITMHPPGLWPIVFSGGSLLEEKPTQLVLSGFWLHPHWLRLDHRMELEPFEGGTVLRQTVRLIGLSQKIFPYFMMQPIRAGFQRMNEVIRDRLERSSSSLQGERNQTAIPQSASVNR